MNDESMLIRLSHLRPHKWLIALGAAAPKCDNPISMDESRPGTGLARACALPALFMRAWPTLVNPCLENVVCPENTSL